MELKDRDLMTNGVITGKDHFARILLNKGNKQMLHVIYYCNKTLIDIRH
jgi:hypothetical protein